MSKHTLHPQMSSLDCLMFYERKSYLRFTNARCSRRTTEVLRLHCTKEAAGGQIKRCQSQDMQVVLPSPIPKCIGENTKTPLSSLWDFHMRRPNRSGRNVKKYSIFADKQYIQWESQVYLKNVSTSYMEASLRIVLKITNLATSAAGWENGGGGEDHRNQIYERKLRRRRSQNEPQTANKKSELLFRDVDDRGGILAVNPSQFEVEGRERREDNEQGNKRRVFLGRQRNLCKYCSSNLC